MEGIDAQTLTPKKQNKRKNRFLGIYMFFDWSGSSLTQTCDFQDKVKYYTLSCDGVFTRMGRYHQLPSVQEYIWWKCSGACIWRDVVVKVFTPPENERMSPRKETIWQKDRIIFYSHHFSGSFRASTWRLLKKKDQQTRVSSRIFYVLLMEEDPAPPGIYKTLGK